MDTSCAHRSNAIRITFPGEKRDLPGCSQTILALILKGIGIQNAVTELELRAATQ